MPPKKKGKKKKGKKKPKEPKHDAGWKKTIENGKWERPLESLPSIERWPTWGEIREKMFAALVKLTIIWSENLGDKFIDELFAVPRPRLVELPPPKPRPPILYILEQEDLRAPIPPPEFGYPSVVKGGYQRSNVDTKGGLSSTRPLIPRTHLFGV